jgi:hypothetical protein
MNTVSANGALSPSSPFWMVVGASKIVEILRYFYVVRKKLQRNSEEADLLKQLLILLEQLIEALSIVEADRGVIGLISGIESWSESNKREIP